MCLLLQLQHSSITYCTTEKMRLLYEYYTIVRLSITCLFVIFMLTIHSHVFSNWEEIPDVSHLLKVENNYVHAFEGHNYEDSTTYVCYMQQQCKESASGTKIVAFGSATYFTAEGNCYVDYDDDNYTPEQQKLWQLWVEGLVSIEKGCGSIVLQALENWLSDVADLHKVERKVINIMSVDESIGFYEENGYVACYTGPRYAGTGNTRVAKAIRDSNFDISLDIQLKPIDHYPSDLSDIGCIERNIARYIVQGRRIVLLPYIEIPKWIPKNDYELHVKSQARNKKHGDKHTLNEYLTESMLNNIFDNIEEMNS